MLADAVLPGGEGGQEAGSRRGPGGRGAACLPRLLAQVQDSPGLYPGANKPGRPSPSCWWARHWASRRGRRRPAAVPGGRQLGCPSTPAGASGYVWSIASGGYIVGFVPAAYAVGWLAERGLGPQTLDFAGPCWWGKRHIVRAGAAVAVPDLWRRNGPAATRWPAGCTRSFWAT